MEENSHWAFAMYGCLDKSDRSSIFMSLVVPCKL